MGTVYQEAEWPGLAARWASHDLYEDAWLVELARWDMVEVLGRDAGPLGKPALQPVRLQPLRRARAGGDQRSGRVDVPVQLGLGFGYPVRIHFAGGHGQSAEVAT